MYSAFTPADQLVEEEPEYFRSTDVTVTPLTRQNDPITVTSLRNAVSILEEGCKKTYAEQPVFTTLSEELTETNVSWSPLL